VDVGKGEVEDVDADDAHGHPFQQLCPSRSPIASQPNRDRIRVSGPDPG
jgi:hypothetical protein